MNTRAGPGAGMDGGPGGVTEAPVKLHTNRPDQDGKSRLPNRATKRTDLELLGLRLLELGTQTRERRQYAGRLERALRVAGVDGARHVARALRRDAEASYALYRELVDELSVMKSEDVA